MFPQLVAIEIGGNQTVVVEIKNDPFPVGGRRGGGHATCDVEKLRHFRNFTCAFPEHLAREAVEAEHLDGRAHMAGDEKPVAPDDRG